MLDIEKQVRYWCDGAEEDWEVAEALLRLKKRRQGLFFLHLSIEKLLKAHVCEATKELAPKTHNLPWLAKRAGLSLSDRLEDIVGDLNAFNLFGRYPGFEAGEPTEDNVKEILQEAKVLREWLIQQLPNPSSDI